MASIWELYVYGQYMGPICIWPVYGSYMYMAGIWELYVYGQYMGPICIWPVYGNYKASTVNSYNPMVTYICDLPGTYMGLTGDI